MLIEKDITLEIDMRRWDQHMFNAFYSYCLAKSVLPKINLLADPQLKLVGAILDVEKALIKCQLMCKVSEKKKCTASWSTRDP